MSVFSDADLLQYLNNKRDLVIHPRVEEAITGNGYDLHIGAIMPLSEINNFYQDDDIIRIPPKAYCIVITEEYVWLSEKLIATLHSRGTLAAKGLFTNATSVDPNFKGQMIMSIYNVSDKDIVIEKKPSPTFITLMVHEVKNKANKTFGHKGTQNSTRVLNQMREYVYVPEEEYILEHRSLNKLSAYMEKCNTLILPEFDRLLAEARKPFNRHGAFLAIKKITWRNCISFIAFVLVIGLLIYNICQIMNNTATFADSYKTIATLVVVAVPLLDKIFKWEEKK